MTATFTSLRVLAASVPSSGLRADLRHPPSVLVRAASRLASRGGLGRLHRSEARGPGRLLGRGRGRSEVGGVKAVSMLAARLATAAATAALRVSLAVVTVSVNLA